MTLVHRFWTHVFRRAAAPAVLLKDESVKGGLASVNWMQAGAATAAFVLELRRLGVDKGDRVAILGWNCPAWVWADMAIQSIGAVTVAIYPNNSAEQVGYIIENSGAKLCFSDDTEQLAKVSSVPGLLYDQVPVALGIEPGKSFLDRVRDGSLTQSAAVAKQLFAIGKGALAQLKKDDLATLVYTSGSSGTPKGCMITHGNIASSLAALIEFGIGQDPEQDRYLSYLPLAHIYERVNGMGMCIWNGVPVAFSPIDQMAKNVGVFKPTMLAGVPAVWQKIRDGVYEPKDGLPRLLSRVGLWKPVLNWAFGLDSASSAGRFVDRVIFAKIRAKFGGKLKLLVSGGAPITPELLKFFNKLGLELLEGYGATETTGGITTNQPSWVAGDGVKNKPGSVGRVVPGAEVRLVPLEGEEDNGVGEIQLRGPQVFAGYWRMPEQTAEALSADGWYRTGDLGRADADGFVYITGRKDGMYKTLGGKYVPREKVEKALQVHPIVQYSVPVAHGRKYTTALIFVSAAEAGKLAGPVPAGETAASFYAGSPVVNAAVGEAVKAANGKLENWEQVKKFKIMPIEATVENGIITPTLKIRSKELIKRFAAEIDEIYAS